MKCERRFLRCGKHWLANQQVGTSLVLIIISHM